MSTREDGCDRPRPVLPGLFGGVLPHAKESPDGHDRVVSNPRRLSLELDPDREIPVGSLKDERGFSVVFHGWLALASALERVLAGHEIHETNSPAGDRSADSGESTANQ